MSAILSVKNLSVSFDDQKIIENLSFAIDHGDNLSIIGPNGSGKTVLLRALLHTVPYEGEILWQPNMRVGYVPQKIDADKHLPLTLKNLLMAKAHMLGVKKTEIASVVKEVGLSEDALGTPIGYLSGGQFQRALVAFALLGHPNLILFDEPTASIDLAGEEQVYELIHRLQEQHGITAIIVSHDLSFVYRYSNKVLCLNRTNVCFGTPEEALDPAMLEKLYGGRHKFYHHEHFHHDK